MVSLRLPVLGNAHIAESKAIMPNLIEFYFDFSSPYAYLGSEMIDELTAKYGRQVKWRPIMLGATFQKTGLPLLVKIPLKGETDGAIARGMFGAPYFIVDNEPFWGADRLPQLEKWLQTGGF